MNEEVEQVRTCGICEMICETSEIISHECLQGYSAYHEDPQTLYFYPVLDDGETIVSKSLYNKRELNVLQQIATSTQNTSDSQPLSKRSNIKKNCKDNDEFKTNFSHEEEELLILEMQNQPCLWNFTMSQEKRKLRNRNEAWDAISEVFENKFSMTQLKRKWKSLSDTYKKIVTNIKMPSGSGRKNVCKWSHFEALSFLRDAPFEVDTTSNFDSSDTGSIVDEEAADDENFATPKHPAKQRKRQCSINEEVSALSKIADAIANQTQVTLPPATPVLPSPPKQDDIDGFLSMLESHLRSLPRLLQLKKMKEISDDMFTTVMRAQTAESDTN